MRDRVLWRQPPVPDHLRLHIRRRHRPAAGYRIYVQRQQPRTTLPRRRSVGTNPRAWAPASSASPPFRAVTPWSRTTCEGVRLPERFRNLRAPATARSGSSSTTAATRATAAPTAAVQQLVHVAPVNDPPTVTGTTPGPLSRPERTNGNPVARDLDSALQKKPDQERPDGIPPPTTSPDGRLRQRGGAVDPGGRRQRPLVEVLSPPQGPSRGRIARRLPSPWRLSRHRHEPERERASFNRTSSPVACFSWLGGSDANHEGFWTWMDGPEATSVFSIGNATSPDFTTNGGERPNNLGGAEHYVYIDAGGFWTTTPSAPRLPPATWSSSPAASAAPMAGRTSTPPRAG